MQTIILSLLLSASAAGLPADDSAPADTADIRLQEITVTHRHSGVRLNGTTLVADVADSDLRHLGNALDVLAQLPMIRVEESSVEVTGKGAPLIYLDGRRLTDMDELLALRSDNISRIEVLLAPGAAYSAETGAVLKITTRRRFADGLSLTERAEASVRRRFSANELLDADYRIGRWNLFASGLLARNNSLVRGSTVNTVRGDGNAAAVVGSTQHNVYPALNGAAKAGFNYASDRLSAGAFYRYAPERGDFTNRGTEWLDVDVALARTVSRSVRAASHFVSAYCLATVADGVELNFDGAFRRSASRGRSATGYSDAAMDEVRSADRRRSALWAGKLTLTAPLWAGQITAGTEDSFTSTSLDFDMLDHEVAGYIPSSFTQARQTAASAFVSWSRSFGPLSLDAGLRYDYVDYRFCADGVRDGRVSRRDHLLTPDLSLGYAFADDSRLSVSYRMSTLRPPYSQLTGSLSYVGRHEIEGGNPALRDERCHNVGLLGSWRDFIVQADFTRSLDTYGFVKRPYPAPSLQLLLYPENIDVSALSLYLIWGRNIGVWTPSVTAGVYRQWLRAGGCGHNRPIWSYSFENTLSLPWGMMLTVNADGRSGGDMHTNRFAPSWFTADLSLSRRFLHDSLLVKLSATDVFNTAVADWSMHTYGVTVSKRQSYDRRGVSLSVRYSFHPRRSGYKGGHVSDAELQRL